jgi:hypothetical protein
MRHFADDVLDVRIMWRDPSGNREDVIDYVITLECL